MPEERLSPNLPAIAGSGLEPSAQYNNYYSEPEGEEPSVPFAHYLWILRRHLWKILAFVFICSVATLVISMRITPIYESTAIVDIDRQMPQGIMGQEATRATTNDADQFLATQVKLIQSDSVLRPVAEKYQLLQRENQLDPQKKERASRIQAAPVLLKKLQVTRPPNTYILQISYLSPDPQLAADVANSIAQSYIEHTYKIRFQSSSGLSAYMEKQLEELRAKMERSGAALAKFERELNVINPEEKTNILTARLLQLNTDYTTAQTDRVRKEAAFQSVKSGTLEAAQVSTQGEALKKLTERLNEAGEKFADARLRYGLNHPEYKKTAGQYAEVQQQLDDAKKNIGQRVAVEYREAADRERMLKQSLDRTKSEFDRLNVRSFEYQALKREAEADKKFYEDLIRKIKEAGINAGVLNNSIRLADTARPGLKPVSPNVKLNVFLAFLLSSILSIAAAIMGDVLDNTVRDPEQVQRLLKTQVIGTLPQVAPKTLNAAAGRNGNGHRSMSLLMRLSEASDQHTGSYVEAIRTLRNSILLGNLDRQVGSLLLTSAGPGEGKTTTAVHLALAHAEQKHNTLLIDCDLRRPSVHGYFGLPNERGVTTVLTQSLAWRDAVIKLEDPEGLHVLPAGPSSRMAADLLGRALPQILAEASREYDLVVVDAPPMLGFAEPLQLATAVDTVVVVSLAGETNRKAIGSVLNALNRVRANVSGLVLNKMDKQMSDGYYYYGYYGKYTKYYSHRDGPVMKA